jgi:ankyrin repeat protein
MLHEAGVNGHRAVCERLLVHGADPSLRDTEYDGTAADWARHGGHAELADLLSAGRT